MQYLLQEGSMLLPPTDTPLTGIEFTRRLPCGETERARKVGSLIVEAWQFVYTIIEIGHASFLCYSEIMSAAARTAGEGATPYRSQELSLRRRCSGPQ